MCLALHLSGINRGHGVGFGFDTSVPTVEDVLDGELLWKTNASWPAGIDAVQVTLEMQGCSLYSLTVSADPCAIKSDDVVAQVSRLRDVSALTAPRNHTEARLVHAEFLRRAGGIRRLYRTAPTTIVAPPAWRTAAAAAQPGQPTADARAFCPTDFGADPTGLVDSTQAVLRAVDSMLAECAANGTAPAPAARPMAPGVRNCGGAVLDLRGGTYLISAPVVIPVRVGNLNINSGTLRASATFPVNRSLVELGNKAVKNGAEFINVHEVFFDSSHVAAGGLLIANCISVTVNACFFVGFTGIGISVELGAETMISNTWLGESFWNEPWNSSDSHSVGIRLASNDGCKCSWPSSLSAFPMA